MAETLGALVRRVRKEAGLTQKTVADAVGIDFTYLSKIENNRLKFPPSNTTLARIAELTRCDPLALIAAAGKPVKVPANELARYHRIEAAATEVCRWPDEAAVAELRRALEPATDPPPRPGG